MEEKSVRLVQQSWQQISANEDAFVQLFYTHLFEINPQLQSLFKRSMKMQGRKLMSMFSSAIASLDSLERVMPALTSAGSRHADYDVIGEHYAQVAQAWQMALAETLGDAYAAETQKAWTQVLGFITAVMKANTDLANGRR